MNEISKALEERNKRSKELLVLKSQLAYFFRHHTTFNIRWKKTRWKDSISLAVFKDEFLAQDQEGFTRKEFKRFLELGLISETTYTDPKRRCKRACVVLKSDLLPQVEPFKKFIARLSNQRPLAWLMKIGYKRLAVAALAVLILALLLVFIPWKKAFGFSSAPERTNIKAYGIAPDLIKYFDDSEAGVRCYWFRGVSALSCVSTRN